MTIVLRSGVEYDTHMDIDANSIRSEAFKKKNPPINDASKLEDKEKQWEIAPGTIIIIFELIGALI